jgi:uncharacterized protein (DUF433 family)
VRWQYGTPSQAAALPGKERGRPLSYLQLVELAVVGAFRQAGVPLVRIRRAREFFAQQFHEEFPFAHYRLVTEGAHVLMHLCDLEPDSELDELVVTDAAGQLAWKQFIGEWFQEFDYENDLALRWHVAGRESPVLIDPRISFGAPTVRGIATWAIKGRAEAGETPEEIAEDFELGIDEVKRALAFEQVKVAA